MKRNMNYKTFRTLNSEFRIHRTGTSGLQSPFIRPPQPRLAKGGRQRGSVLIVVIGLLLLLMLIGLTFFTFATQEYSASQYYAESYKKFEDAPNSDILFDWALEQLIIGPHDDNTQSCLWPGRHSMVPNMLGMFKANPGDYPPDPSNPGKYLKLFYPLVPADRHPNNGTGIHIVSGRNSSGVTTGAPVVDQNFNGIDDSLEVNPVNDSRLMMNLNFSAAAQLSAMGMGAASSTRQALANTFPSIDVGYTYPDINNMFLAHVSVEPSTGNVVVIPSFFRPGLMRDDTGAPLLQWHVDNSGNAVTDTTTRSLQAHPGHLALRWDGDVGTNVPYSMGTRRFLSSAIVAGSTNPVTGQVNSRTIQYFGYPGQPFYGTLDGSGNPLARMGVYTDPTLPGNLDYPVKNRDSNLPDGNWHDLGYPVTTLSDGRKLVPLFSYLVFDADSLINQNTSGNTSWLASLQRPLYGNAPGGSAVPNASISHSNLGTSRSEINPIWALIANPRSTTYLQYPNTAANGPNDVFQTYRGVFGLSNLNPSTANGYDIDRIEAANMDMLFMLWGRPDFNVTLNGSGKELFAVKNLTPGLWGEVGYLLSGLSTGSYGNSPPTNLNLFPKPGIPNYDDNGNLLFGLTDAAYMFNGNMIGGDPAVYQIPLPLLSPLGSTNLLYPQIPGYAGPLSSPATVLPFAQPLDFTGAGQWLITGSTHGMRAALAQPTTSPATYPQYNGYQGSSPNYIPYQSAFGGILALNSKVSGVIDEADEKITDPSFTNTSDHYFATEETAALQLDQNDYLTALGQSRLRKLLGFNLDGNLQAQLIRRHFTTESADRRQHGFGATISPNTVNGSGYASNNLSGDRFWEYARGNWDGTSPAGGPYLQFPPMVLSSSTTSFVPFNMDGRIPDQVNNPGLSNPLNTGAAGEPFRMELAALIGAKLNDPVTFVNGSGTKFTPAPYQYRSSQAPSTPWHQQARLNINRFLTAANPASAFGSSGQQNQQNPLRYRELTPHPTTAQWASYASPSTAITGSVNGSFVADVPLFATRPDVQEFWARRDRQQMARDIYVMLYMFGGGLAAEDANGNGTLDSGEDINGNGVLDYYVQNFATVKNQPVSAANLVRPLYEDWQLYEMAQFAVNVVDSLDRDNVITVFEFDMDLQDGWNLDDNPYGLASTQEVRTSFPNASGATDFWKTGDRGVVYGVEAQQLAFSEALVVVAPYVKTDPNGTPANTTPIDHPATAWNDSIRDRTFTYLELYNVSPYPVSLASANWQIMVLNPVDPDAYLSINPATSTAWSLLTLTSGGVGAGQSYTIGSYTYDSADAATSGFANPVSRLVVDPNWTSAVTNPDAAFLTPALSQIVPGYNTNASAFPSLDLDLVFSYGGSAYTLTDGGYNPISTQGGFLDMASPTSTTAPASLASVAAGVFAPNYQTTFLLRRRLNPDRPAPTISVGSSTSADEADNPWVEVDRINYWNQIPPSDPSGGPPASNPPGAFYNLRSTSDSQLGGAANAGAFDIQPKLARLQSRERRQALDGFEGSTAGGAGSTTNPPVVAPPGPTVPNGGTSSAAFTLAGASRVYFNGNGVPLGGSGAVTAHYNTVGSANFYTTTGLSGIFTLWQPHFDRDFASVMELLSIPLYGPSSVTQNLAPHGIPALNTLATESPSPATAGSLYMPLVAQAKFLRPQYPANTLPTPLPAPPLPIPPYPKYDNRWHRVLELLEVPPRENLQVETTLLKQYPWLFPQALQRTPGKMNLNTLRHGENLFALLDDPMTFDVTSHALFGTSLLDGTYTDAFSSNDALESGSRNWWQQLLYARDGLDPSSGLYLPGTPSSRPFRNLSQFDSAAENDTIFRRNSFDDTLLRTLPMDVSSATTLGLEKRGLFEARTKSDLVNSSAGAGNSVDYYTRQRLLSKIAGNTTPRSNVFLVWVTVGFFEAYELVPEDAPGTNGSVNGRGPVIQIGAKASDQPDHRGFFVVDRTLLEDAWIPLQLDINNNPVAGTGIYDFNKFVRYRKTLQ
ncbi:MAG: hypothetical protein HY290_10100 [Planctomycetia bacterium]|nr:hypothetical protein [Planctomycetia bacterium]